MFEPFAEVPGYPLVFVLFWGAAAFFALAMARHLRVFAAARAAGPSPFADIPRRFAGLIQYAFVQSRMFRDLRAGLMHAGIFWGFILLTIGTANIVTGGLIEAVLSIPFDGLLWARSQRDAERRRGDRPGLHRLGVLAPPGDETGSADLQPRRPDHPGDDRRGRRDRAARRGRSSSRATATSRARSCRPRWPCRFGRRFSESALETGFAVLWWGHMLLVAAFLAYLPFSKHLHIATSFPNIWFRKLRPRGELPKLDIEDETATFGLRTLQDLGWKDLLDGFTCTECGRCQEACPAWNTGKPLNPKTFIMGIRDMSVEAEHGLDLIPNSPIVRDTYGLDDTQPNAEALARPIVDTAIPYDAVWDCVTCGACVEACPVLIEHVDKIVGLRRNLVLEDSRFPQELTTRVPGHGGPGQPVGPARLGPARLDEAVAVRGADGRGGRRRPGELDELEVLYWVGCAAAFDPRNQKVARAVATCLHAAGVSFAVLGQEESCTGDPARRMGNDYVFQILASGNVDTLNRYGMGERTIVTACPHCFNTIGNEYGQLGGAYRVVHHSTYLAELVASGRLATLPEDATSETGDHRPGSVTVHDSCYLARYNGVIAAPRDVLGAAGVAITEMERIGKPDVLLRRRRRPDVDGGDARDADQRGADAPGPRDRRRRRSPRPARSAW